MTEGYKQTEIGMIPEDWEVKSLKDIAPLQRGFDLPYSQMKEGKYPVVFSNGIGAYHERYMVNGPGVITGRSGTIGNVHFVPQNYWPHNTSLWVTDFRGNDEKYVYYLFQTIPWELYNSGSGVPTLNRNDVHDTLHAVPPPTEQRRIAEALSDVDELITSLEKLIAKKKAIKQGAMQELLTGKRRLPGFSGEWKTSSLITLCDSITDGSHESPLETDCGYYMPSVKDMTDCGFNYSACKQISKLDYEKLVRNGCQPVVGDVLIAKDGSILKHAFVYEQSVPTVILSSITIIRPNKAIIDSQYLAQYFRQKSFVENVILNYKSGTGVPRIVLNNFKIIEIFHPISVKEQIAISETLGYIDVDIEMQEKKVEKARQIKQGMMQQLLTGKIRI